MGEELKAWFKSKPGLTFLWLCLGAQVVAFILILTVR